MKITMEQFEDWTYSFSNEWYEWDRTVLMSKTIECDEEFVERMNNTSIPIDEINKKIIKILEYDTQ